MDMDNVPEEFMTFGVGDLWKRGVILRMTLNASGCSPGFSLIILSESGAVSTDWEERVGLASLHTTPRSHTLAVTHPCMFSLCVYVCEVGGGRLLGLGVRGVAVPRLGLHIKHSNIPGESYIIFSPTPA